MTPEPRIEPDEVYEPDYPKDIEAAEEIEYYVDAALHQATDGNGPTPYDHRPDRKRSLILICGEILNPDGPVMQFALDGSGYLAAKAVVAFQQKYFGTGGDGAGPFRDPELVSLQGWLNRRRR
jgi:hypothetical protein